MNPDYKDAVPLLDINNSVPADLYEEDIKGRYDYSQRDLYGLPLWQYQFQEAVLLRDEVPADRGKSPG